MMIVKLERARRREAGMVVEMIECACRSSKLHAIFVLTSFFCALLCAQLNAAAGDDPRNASSFELIDQMGRRVTEKTFKGKPSIVFFGFTHCPDICPMTLAQLASMFNILEQTQRKTLPQVVLVSVDPQRDSAEQLSQYVTTFNPNFIGVTGEQAQLAQLAQELGIAYMKINPQAPDTDVHSEHAHHEGTEDEDNATNYQIEHSGTIILFNPEGKLAGFFTMPHDAKHLAQDLQTIMG